MKISEIISVIEEVAPLPLQESYDNAGLQVGNKNNEATGALLCIDVTEDIIDEAIENGLNLVISHHPLIFKSIKSITGKNYIERAIIKAIKNDIAIYSAHTNLDNAFGGVNFKIAEKLGLSDIKVLSPIFGRMLKLTVFVPTESADEVRNSILSSGAGEIGSYDMCSYNMEGYGTFRAKEGANPYCGEIGSIHKEKEVRIEVILPDYNKNRVLKSMMQSHPYEEPAYDIIPLANSNNYAGSGVVGELIAPMNEEDFLAMVKNVFHVGALKYSSLTGKKVKRVALCGGSGAFLFDEALRVKADAFITGEIGYHNYFMADGQILMVEAGHYETEQYTKDIFCDIITKKFPNFAVQYTNVETNPINYL